MKNIALGRYIPYDTIIHRLDPRTKLLLMIALLVAIFFPLTYWQYGLMIIVILILLKIKFSLQKQKNAREKFKIYRFIYSGYSDCFINIKHSFSC